MPDALDIFVFVCWFAGGFVSGVSGIGGTMFAFPFLALAISMHALIPLSCLVCFFKDACMIAMHVRFCRFDAMPWLLLGAVGYRGFVSVEMARTDLDTVKRTLDYVAEVFQ